MIEILILYTLHKREKTLYAIRKDIIDVFGTFTRPSIGTIYPALKRLLKEEAVTVREKMSDGGKKSSYYSITNKGLVLFRKLFFSAASENPSIFYNQLQARLGTMGLLSVEDRKEFVKEFLRKIDIYQFELERKLKDEFLEPDYYQRRLLDKNFAELESLKEFISSLKVDHAG